MASLTRVAYTARKVIKIGGGLLVAIVIFYSVATAAIAAYRAAHPPYVAPTVKYGVLPKIVFPDKEFSPKNFVLELPNDSFPKISDQAKVYIVYKPKNSFMALEYDSKSAQELGFTEKPNEKGPGIYEFSNSEKNLTLIMNVVDGSFKLSYPYLTDQSLLNPEQMPGKDEAIKTAKEYLERANKYSSDLQEGEKKVTFWKIEYDGLKAVSSQSEANVARVDLFRQKLETNLPILTEVINKAPVSLLVSGAVGDGKQVVEVNYKNTNIDRESFSTYPIKTPEEAWNELKSGNYWPVSDTTSSSVTIRKVYLAYFEPVTLVNYLQPIYVFEGDNNFAAYVRAVTDQWMK